MAVLKISLRSKCECHVRAREEGRRTDGLVDFKCYGIQCNELVTYHRRFAVQKELGEQPPEQSVG